MSEYVPEWSTSQKTAFGYAQQAVTIGLNQTVALREYRSGGGQIRTEAWSDVYRTAFQAAGWREDVRSTPLHWGIPEAMFTPADVDWSTKYVFRAEIEYYDLDTERWESKWVSAGFDELPTHAEWRADALRRMDEEETSPRRDEERGVRWLTEETWKRRYP